MTPEPLWLDPVTSPTGELDQTIVVYIGNGETVTVTWESGTFPKDMRHMQIGPTRECWYNGPRL
jgi:hypothetical protein